MPLQCFGRLADLLAKRLDKRKAECVLPDGHGGFRYVSYWAYKVFEEFDATVSRRRTRLVTLCGGSHYHHHRHPWMVVVLVLGLLA
jgi:hypothetical protein